MYGLFYILYVLMLLLNLLLLYKATTYAAAKNRSLQRPIITTLFISGLFIIGWTLYMGWISTMVYLRTRVQFDAPINGRKYRTILNGLEFGGYFLYSISTWGNPIIYTMVNRRFRKLVENRGTQMVQTSIQNIQTLSRPIRVSIENTISSSRRSLKKQRSSLTQMDTVSELGECHRNSPRSKTSSIKSKSSVRSYHIDRLSDGATPV
jgi:hypothetical protein